MSRVVLSLERPPGGQPLVRMLEPDRPDADLPVSLDAGIPLSVLQKISVDPLVPNTMQEIGKALLDLLGTHQDVKEVLRPYLRGDVHDERPIYLFIRDSELEKLPWEALHAPDSGFIATDSRWPIARAVKVLAAKTEAAFLPPLKILAVLGASGDTPTTRLSAKAEWENLIRALEGSDLNIRLHVLTCEEDLQAEIKARGLPWVTVDGLIDTQELFRSIRQFDPHLLHFYCHGSAKPTPRLEIGSQLDWELNRPGGIIIEGGQLREHADPDEKVWLVTLNCCESAQEGNVAGSRSLPMAKSLANARFPAVVGMREQVETNLAHTFCGMFYESLLQELRKRFDAARQEGQKEIHWACGMYGARQQICRQLRDGAAVSEIAPDFKEWTYPVLYTRVAPFSLRLLPDPDGQSPVMRPKPAAQAPAGPPKPQNLTAKEIKDLAEELIQLHEERERFKGIPNLEPVLRKIDERIGEINAKLA